MFVFHAVLVDFWLLRQLHWRRRLRLEGGDVLKQLQWRRRLRLEGGDVLIVTFLLMGLDLTGLNWRCTIDISSERLLRDCEIPPETEVLDSLFPQQL